MREEKFTWIHALIIILFVIVVYMLLTKIFGHSATELAIMVGLFALLFVNQYHLNRELGELKINTKQGFQKVKEDMELIKKKLKV